MWSCSSRGCNRVVVGDGVVVVGNGVVVVGNGVVVGQL